MPLDNAESSTRKYKVERHDQALRNSAAVSMTARTILS